MDIINGIMAFESGELDMDETLSLFSKLIKTGTINSLQGFYHRTAQHLIDTCLISTTGDILIDTQEN